MVEVVVDVMVCVCVCLACNPTMNYDFPIIDSEIIIHQTSQLCQISFLGDDNHRSIVRLNREQISINGCILFGSEGDFTSVRVVR